MLENLTIQDIKKNQWISKNFNGFKGKNILAEHKKSYPSQVQ